MDYSPYVSPFVTNADRPIYCVTGLPEEIVAVLFAYYSRSRGTLRENLARLLAEGDVYLEQHAAPSGDGDFPDELARARQKAASFHERWVVGYGHSSVAEHAVAHVAVEDVSIQVAKVIEDCRLAAYTEKSTRYVPFDRARVFQPNLVGEDLAVYSGAIAGLFDCYESLLPLVHGHFEARVPRSRFKTDAGRENALMASALDVVRYLLPVGCLTNMGITLNGRTAAHMIRKLRSHELPEAQYVGDALFQEIRKVLPTLVEYCDTPSPYRQSIRPLVAEWLEDHPELAQPPAERPVSGAAFEKRTLDEREALQRICAAILFPYSPLPYDKVRCRVKWLDRGDLVDLVQRYCRGRSFFVRRGTDEERELHEQVLRAFEEVSVTTEFVCDYGAWRDIQRHRMATQYLQDWTWSLGYEIPDRIVEFGLQDPYRRAMDQAGIAFKKLRNAGVPEASYVLPLGWRVRSLFTWNLRELDHFIRLRSGRNGNPSYRRLAQQCHAELEQRMPVLAALIPCDRGEYDVSRH